MLGNEGIETVRTPVQASRVNVYAERWIETLRAECLDHLLIVSVHQLERVLAQYLRQYNRARPHRSLGLAIPEPTDTEPSLGVIERHDVLAGLIHEL